MADILNTIKNTTKKRKTDVYNVKINKDIKEKFKIDDIIEPTKAMIDAVIDNYIAGEDNIKILQSNNRDNSGRKLSRNQIVQIIKTAIAVSIVDNDPLNYKLSEDGTEAIYIGVPPEV